MLKKKPIFALSSAFAALLVAQTALAEDAEPTARQTATKSDHISTLLQDFTQSPLAGGPVHIRVCTQDGSGQKDCALTEIIIPIPQFDNPLGAEVQKLRRALALAVETAQRDNQGQPIARSVYDNVLKVTGEFEDLFDTHSTGFQNYETLIALLDLHYDLVSVEATPSLDTLKTQIVQLATIIQKLEDDLLTPAQRALRDAQEALQEARENGASQEELDALAEDVVDALEATIEEQKHDKGLSAGEQQALEDLQDMLKALREVLEELGITPEEYAEMLQNMLSDSPPSGTPPSQAQQGEKPSYEEILEALKQQIEMLQKMQKYIKELKAIIEEQKTLRDDALSLTLRSQNGLSDPDRKLLENYESVQDGLTDRLKTMLEDMRKDDIPVDALEHANGEMLESTKDLSAKRSGEAIDHMDEAIKAMTAANEDNQQALAMMMPGGGGNQSSHNEGESPEAGDFNGQKGNVIDGGTDRGSRIENLNEDLGIETEQGGSSKDVRDRILERQEGAGSSYLERLLEPE